MLSFLKNGGIYSDVSFYDAFSLASIAAKARTVEIDAFTLPGVAMASKSGVWYYILNREETINLFASYYDVSNNSFDKNRLFEYSS